MVPMKMRNEDVSLDRLVLKFPAQLLAQLAKARAAIKDVDRVSEANFDAGGVAAVAEIARLRRRRGATHAPESNQHEPPNVA